MNQIRNLAAFLVVFCISNFSVSAKEGMWIPSLLGAVTDDMTALGLQLSPEDLYSVNEGSLKDAIVLFGGGCTAEIVSDNGLLFTNHHCGLDMIQYHSSVSHDYVTNGFWATDHASELVCPGLTVMFIVRMDDVTARVMEGYQTGMNSEEIEKIKGANRKKIEEDYKSKNPGLGIQFKTFNYGNQYMVMITKTYNDVRLVGAPPSAIGKFGGDTDNWVWPRHTGDFSVFRIYANTENQPAPYSTSNIPFKPAHHFPISLDGVHEGDFSMVYGFPGRTDHYLTSYAVDYVVNKSNPMKIHMRETTLDLLDEKMRASDEVRIKYIAKQSGIANAWKKWDGQNIGLKNFDAIDQKQNTELLFTESLKDEGRKDLADILPSLQSLYKEIEPYNLAREAFVEYVYFGPELFAFANSFRKVVENYDTLVAKGMLDETITALKVDARIFYKDFDLATEQAIYERLTPVLEDYVARYSLGSLLPAGEGSSKVDYNLKDLHAATIFRDSTVLFPLLDHFGKKSIKKFQKDYFYLRSIELYDANDKIIRPGYLPKNAQIESLMQRYVKGTMELFPKVEYWADANSTLRISFGKVQGSVPRDGMIYNYYTTSDGILDKFEPTNPDFEMPQRLIDLFRQKQFGVYGENNELRICYTGSNHTTGGNSGSPALNAKGELTGINFDRSWESTMSDIMYNPDICRNIMVDIRYVLWVIDVYAEADWLIRELSLVKSNNERPEVN